MNQPSRRRSHAFTIVELLVAIVIIAILAVLTITAYNGAQRRAYNAQITQGVAQYLKAIQTYKGLNGVYPKVSNEEAAPPFSHVSLTCLGKGYPGLNCGKVSGVDITEDSGFNTAIRDVLKDSVPIIGKNVIPVSGGETFIGAVYGIDRLNPDMYGGLTYGRVINYALLGKNEKCTVADARQYGTVQTTPVTTACEIFISDK